MENADTQGLTTEPGISVADWELAFRVLRDLLIANKGCVSSTAVRRELEEKHQIVDARPLVVALKYFDPESSAERSVPLPDFKFHHLERSFYSDEKYTQEAKKHDDATTREAEAAGRKALAAAQDEPADLRTNRQEEARLVTYVKRALEEIYASEAESEDEPFVFDVHSLRKGSNFENVDLLAVHRRHTNVWELITVEVKLEFNAQVVQQAVNYTRFSHRAWVAVSVASQSELREGNPALFEYAISRGVGLLACRRGKGRSYEVIPVHWPLRNQIDPCEEEGLKERYRSELEDAGVLEKERRKLPRLR